MSTKPTKPRKGVNMKIIISEFICEDCIIQEDVQKVYDKIFSELRNGNSVELDFTNIKVIASPFLNASIGHLIKDISSDDLNRLLIIQNMPASGVEVLKRVIENSKKYYANPDIKKTLDEVLKEQSKEK